MTVRNSLIKPTILLFKQSVAWMKWICLECTKFILKQNETVKETEIVVGKITEVKI